MLRKRRYCLILLMLLIALSACSKKEDTPEERLSAYIDLWVQGKYPTMYDDYLTESAKEIFGKEQFIERTEKLYKDLDITSVEVNFEQPTESKQYKKDEVVEFPVQIKMETIAGPIEFKKTVPLAYEEKEETSAWFIEWDPSFILPDLTMHDKVGITALKSNRGEIYDRHNKAVAINGSGAEIGVVAGKFNIEADGEKLAGLLGITRDYISEQMNQNWVQEGHFVPLKKIPFTQEHTHNEAVQIAGVTSVKADMREYPYAKSLAHLIGYTGPINADELEKLKDKGYTQADIVGKRGLEQLLEERLRGEDGIRIYIEKTGQNEERITIAEKPAADGEHITLTIDAEFQKSIYEEMNGEPGTAAVVDPKSGDTLVLASSPAFDPNELALGISAARYNALTEDSNQPLLNRFAASYAPGSSIKPITAAIGLSAGTLKPDRTYTIEGKRWQKDSSWGNFHITRVFTPPNPVDLKKALIYSDNIYFAKEALEMGSEELINGLKAFGFEEEIPFSYPLRTSQISNDGKLSSEGQLADTSFGQGQMLMNILHLASSYGAIINDGQIIKPVLFADEKKNEVWKENLLTAENAAILRDDLRAVITDGFAEAANIPTPKISGKTGTAELKSNIDEAGKENGFFVAYPTEEMDYIIAMMIEGVESKGGSAYVAEKVANVMKKQ